MRKEYQKERLTKQSVNPDPLLQFEYWFKEAVKNEGNEANAFVLSTMGLDDIPEGRIVLLKCYAQDGFTFYTNYNSAKAAQLKKHPFASMTFHWRSLERQIRVKGKVSIVDPLISDEYFKERPTGSKLGAWASPQSDEIPDREYLERKFNEIKTRFPDEDAIPRPDFWGGFLLHPVKLEFWQGRANRLHDRIVYELVDEKWQIKRVAP